MKYKFFDLARKLSKRSNHNRFKLGCVIIQKNRVLGMGFNMIKTHPRSLHPFRMLHAEISALIGLSTDELKGASAYIFREKKDGSPAMARPCGYCLQALSLAGIEKIYYSSVFGYKEEVI